jgi:hypothetical protein
LLKVTVPVGPGTVEVPRGLGVAKTGGSVIKMGVGVPTTVAVSAVGWFTPTIAGFAFAPEILDVAFVTANVITPLDAPL